jgi:hypothetical protein
LDKKTGFKVCKIEREISFITEDQKSSLKYNNKINKNFKQNKNLLA